MEFAFRVYFICTSYALNISGRQNFSLDNCFQGTSAEDRCFLARTFYALEGNTEKLFYDFRYCNYNKTEDAVF